MMLFDTSNKGSVKFQQPGCKLQMFLGNSVLDVESTDVWTSARVSVCLTCCGFETLRKKIDDSYLRRDQRSLPV